MKLANQGGSFDVKPAHKRWNSKVWWTAGQMDRYRGLLKSLYTWQKNAGKQDPEPAGFHFRIVSDRYNFIRQQNMTEHTSSQL